MNLSSSKMTLVLVFILPGLLYACSPGEETNPTSPDIVPTQTLVDKQDEPSATQAPTEKVQIAQVFATDLQPPFSEVPIPEDANIEAVGQNGFSYTTNVSIADLAVFYKEGMTILGWQEVPGKAFFLMNQLYQNEFDQDDITIAIKAENQEGTNLVTIVLP